MNNMQFIGGSDFLQQFKNEMIPEIKRQLSSEFQPKEPTEYLTRNEVCKLLKIDLSTLHRWRTEKIIPSYGVGNRVYFKRQEIDEIINTNKLS